MHTLALRTLAPRTLEPHTLTPCTLSHRTCTCSCATHALALVRPVHPLSCCPCPCSHAIPILALVLSVPLLSHCCHCTTGSLSALSAPLPCMTHTSTASPLMHPLPHLHTHLRSPFELALAAHIEATQHLIEVNRPHQNRN